MLRTTSAGEDELMPRANRPILSNDADTASTPPRPRIGRTSVLASQEAIEEVVARIRPSVERLLADDIPRSRRSIAQALAATHARKDIARTIMRLAVTGRLVEVQNRYTLAPPVELGPDGTAR
jgi:hypothetical protein